MIYIYIYVPPAPFGPSSLSQPIWQSLGIRTRVDVTPARFSCAWLMEKWRQLWYWMIGLEEDTKQKLKNGCPKGNIVSLHKIFCVGLHTNILILIIYIYIYRDVWSYVQMFRYVWNHRPDPVDDWMETLWLHTNACYEKWRPCLHMGVSKRERTPCLFSCHQKNVIVLFSYCFEVEKWGWSYDQWWSMMINDDQWWSMMINDDQWWSMMINDDQWWSMMINDDQCIHFIGGRAWFFKIPAIPHNQDPGWEKNLLQCQHCQAAPRFSSQASADSSKFCPPIETAVTLEVKHRGNC